VSYWTLASDAARRESFDIEAQVVTSLQAIAYWTQQTRADRRVVHRSAPKHQQAT